MLKEMILNGGWRESLHGELAMATSPIGYGVKRMYYLIVIMIEPRNWVRIFGP